MPKTAPPFRSRKSRNRSRERPPVVRDEQEDSVLTSEIPDIEKSWRSYTAAQGVSPLTSQERSRTVLRLIDWLESNGHKRCGREELLGFFGTARNLSTGESLRPWTRATLHNHLRSFFGWAREEQIVAVSPMERVPRPIMRPDQKPPLSEDQLKLLINAARDSYYPKHNEAVIRFLLDTGLRVTEFCNLNIGDCDLGERSVSFKAKGDKMNYAYYGIKTSRAMWATLSIRGINPREESDKAKPLFVAQSGPNVDSRYTRSGVQQLIYRLGKAAGITGVSVCPHALRRTFAINFIMNGGDAFTLKNMLGHTTLNTTNIYVNIANSNRKDQHAKFSPVDNLPF